MEWPGLPVWRVLVRGVFRPCVGPCVRNAQDVTCVCALGRVGAVGAAFRVQGALCRSLGCRGAQCEELPDANSQSDRKFARLEETHLGAEGLGV